MADNQIKIEITAGTEELVKALQSADKAAVKFSANLTSSFAPIRTAAEKTSNGIKEGFSSAFTSMAKGVAVGNLVSGGIIAAFSAVKNFLTGSIAAAEEQEKAINRLGQALKAAGSYSNEAVADFSIFASEMQKVSVYGDEVVLGQIAIAKSFGATNDQAKELIKAAANLAATMGGSLEERVQQLGKTFTGSAGRLGLLIPGFKSLTEAQLKSGEAASFVNSKFGGAAANELETYSGKVVAMKNALSDFQEELGATFTQSDYVQTVTEGLTLVFSSFTQKIADARTESARQNEGFVETSASLAQLKRKHDDLTLSLLDYEAVQQKAKASPFSIDSGTLSVANVRVKSLTAELATLKAQIDKASGVVNKAKATGPTETPTVTPETPEEKNKAAKLLADRAAVEQQLLQQESDFAAYRAQLELDKNTLTQEQRAVEYQTLLESEQAKIEAVRAAELAKAQLITDTGLKKATIDQINNKADLDRSKVFMSQKNKQEAEGLANQKALNAGYLSASDSFIQAGLVMAKEGSIAQKALQITQATISTYVAATNALATVPYPANIAAASGMVALGLANVAKISGAKFASGGIVPGSSFAGDKVPALVNSGEMILNKNQQTELFRQANGSGNSGGNMAENFKDLIEEIRATPIVVHLNGREIARAVRDEQKNGFEVFA